MKRITIEANGKDEYSWAPKSGWVHYVSGWGVIAAAIPVMIIGIQNDLSPMIIGGIAGSGLGEVLHVISWFKFNQQKKYWNNKFDQLSFSPRLLFDENKNCLLGINFQYNF